MVRPLYFMLDFGSTNENDCFRTLKFFLTFIREQESAVDVDILSVTQ